MKGLIHVLPMLSAYIGTYILLLMLDGKYSILSNIKSKIKIKQNYISLFCAFSTMGSILILGIIGIYVIDIPNFLFYILSGITLALFQLLAQKKLI